MNRVNEITFNSSLLKELRAIEFVGRLIYEGALDESCYRKLRLHLLDYHDELTEMGVSSKLKAEEPLWAGFSRSGESRRASGLKRIRFNRRGPWSRSQGNVSAGNRGTTGTEASNSRLAVQHFEQAIGSAQIGTPQGRQRELPRLCPDQGGQGTLILGARDQSGRQSAGITRH